MQSVAELIPHQPPMRLLDEILANTDDSVWATCCVTEAFAFHRDNGVRACFGLEFIAQTAAAFFTLTAAKQAAPRQGMLIASRHFTSRLPLYPTDSQLLIHASLASPLPTDLSASALVRFNGGITVFRQATSMPRTLPELQALNTEHADSQASLSVYL